MKTFEERQSEILNNFQRQMKNISSDIISSFYTDVTPYAQTDAHINFTNALKDELSESLCDEISSKYSHYSWASTIRMKLLSTYKDQLQNKIIQDLQEKISSLENHIQQITSRRY